MSKLFDLDYLIEDTNVATIDAMSEYSNVSYFSLALRFLEESNKSYNLASKVLYKSIIESDGNLEYINESFETFFDNVKKIIDKFLKFVKSLFDRFLTALNRFVKNEKYLLKHLSELDKFKPEHEFKYSGYEYTINGQIPAINALETFSNGFLFDGETVNPADENVADTIKQHRANLEASLRDDYYDKFRARVLNKTGIIYASTFQNDLVREYRNGDITPEERTINKHDIEIISARFKNYKETERMTKRDRDRVKNEYETIKRMVETVYRRDLSTTDHGKITLPDSEETSVTLSPAAMHEFDLFVKAKTNQVQEMSEIHLLAFSAKLDAIAECFKQDKAVLYKALDRVQKVKLFDKEEA